MVRKPTKWYFLEPFLYLRGGIHLAEISRKLKKPHSTVREYMELFEKQGILIREIKGKMSFYHFNTPNPMLIDYLTIAEKEKLVRKCQKDLLLKEIVSFLHENFEKSKIVLFGSAVKNTARANDIDMIITGRLDKRTLIKSLETKLGIKIEIINVMRLSEITPVLKQEVINKHLIIQGTEDVVRWMLKDWNGA